jgi:hypothetical protein
MNNSIRAIALPFCAAALVAACSDSNSSTAAPKDAGPAVEAGADTSPPSDAGTDTSTVPDAADAACGAYTGPVPGDAGALCHDVVSNAPRVTDIADPGTQPVGTGGTISDGLYYVTEARYYPGSPVAAGTMLKYAVLFIGDMSYIVDDNNPAQTIRRTKMKNPDGGAAITLCETQAEAPDTSTSTSTATCSQVNFNDSRLFSTKFVKQ